MFVSSNTSTLNADIGIFLLYVHKKCNTSDINRMESPIT